MNASSGSTCIARLHIARSGIARPCSARRGIARPCLIAGLALLAAFSPGFSPGVASAQGVGSQGVGAQAAAPVRGAPAWGAALSAFGDALARDVARDDLGGIVAGVAVDGDLVWAGAFGWADRERQIPMTTAAISRTGSISKPVTAMLLMRLVDQGILSLDDPVVRYLPELRELEDPDGHLEAVTFRLLASHRGGLVREPRLPGAASGPITEWETQLLRAIPTTSFAQPPGAGTLYSNIGYGILGLALSRAAGRPFIDLVEDEVFRPLGMTGSTFVVDEGLTPRLAAGYVRSASGEVDGRAPAREHAGRGYKVPNGGVYSTVADLARFAAAASGTPGLQILSEGARGELITVQNGSASGYGVGFSVQVAPDGRRLVSHGGSVAGYTAHMVFDPDSRISVIVLRNYGTGATNLAGASTALLRELRAGDALDADEQLAGVESRLLEEGLRGGLSFEVSASGAFEARLAGTVRAETGGAVDLTAQGTFGGESVTLALSAQDGQMSGGSEGRPQFTAPTPPALHEALVIGLTRMGVLHNLARLASGTAPDHAEGGVADWVEAREVQWAVGEAEVGVRGISFEIWVSGQPAGEAIVWLDAEGQLAGRTQTVRFPGGEMVVRERYHPWQRGS